MNTICEKCGSFCPSGTLLNNLCLDCDLIGKRISVLWGKFGVVSCLVEKVSMSGVIYAKRWNRRQNRWTVAKPVIFYKGYRLKY